MLTEGPTSTDGFNVCLGLTSFFVSWTDCKTLFFLNFYSFTHLPSSTKY
jgi:hypothetical protein